MTYLPGLRSFAPSLAPWTATTTWRAELSLHPVSRVQQVLTKLLIEQTFTKVVGSLFVRIDEFLINDVPMYDWEQARTTVPVEQPALFAD